MNKIYDKLLFVVALLILGVGVGFYFMNTGAVPESSAEIAPPSGAAYESIPIPRAGQAEANWPEAEPQSSTWVYDVFTPPKIYINKDGDFTIEAPYDDTLPPPPFGLYLATMEPELYRIQLEGYIEEDLSDSNKSLLLFYDVQAEDSLRLRPGSKSDASEFEVISFDVKRNVGDDGSITKTATTKIMDLRASKEVVLTHKEPLYEDRIEIVLRSNEDPSIEVRPQAAGEQFETPLGQYVLDAIDLDGQTVTVTKQETQDFDAETQVLGLKSQTEEPETTNSETTTTTPDSGSALDALFQ